MQVDPVKPKLKPPKTKRLRLKDDELLSNAAFKFNLRRFILGFGNLAALDFQARCMSAKTPTVERCRLTLSNPR